MILNICKWNMKYGKCHQNRKTLMELYRQERCHQWSFSSSFFWRRSPRSSLHCCNVQWSVPESPQLENHIPIKNVKQGSRRVILVSPHQAILLSKRESQPPCGQDVVADRMRGDGWGGCRGGDVEQLWLAGHHFALPETESEYCSQACARITAVSP